MALNPKCTKISCGKTFSHYLMQKNVESSSAYETVKPSSAILQRFLATQITVPYRNAWRESARRLRSSLRSIKLFPCHGKIQTCQPHEPEAFERKDEPAKMALNLRKNRHSHAPTIDYNFRNRLAARAGCRLAIHECERTRHFPFAGRSQIRPLRHETPAGGEPGGGH